MTELDFAPSDQAYMQQALTLAAKGQYSTKPNPAVGCVLVKEGRVIGEGWHQKAGLPHAEREALMQAGSLAKGATAYVTLEPCSHFGRTPPCADGLIEAGVKMVWIAMLDPNPLVSGQGVQKLQQAGIKVKVGLLEQEARALNVGFIHRMEVNLPYVILKMASSLDGRTAMANGESKWITGELSRQEVHKLRASCGAIVTGIGTVLADDPSLTVRLPDATLAEMNLTSESTQPLRVILDPNLKTPLDARMLSLTGRTILVTSNEAFDSQSDKVKALSAQKAEVLVVPCQEDRLDIKSVLQYLAKEEQINHVMVESGAVVAGAFMQSGLVNELHSFIAPSLLGDQAKPMLVLPNLQNMADKIQLNIHAVDQFGEDVRLILKPKVVKK